MKRSKLLALVGAGVLAMGVVGVALAEELNEGQEGQALSTFDQDCSDFAVQPGAGEIGVHFVLTDPAGGATSATLDAVFSTDTVTDLANTPKPSTTLHFYAIITGDADTTIISASTDVDGGQLNVSHVCLTEEETTTTSFSSSEESTTESTSSEETTTSFSSSEESTTESTSSEETTTSFSSSEQSTTDSQSSSTSFSDSISSTTTQPTQPPSDTLGETGSGQQSGSMWLLLAALGALGGSLIVLAPSKAKDRD
jgi:hypothetical protein